MQSKIGVWYEDTNSTLATSLFDYFTSLSKTEHIAWNINNIGLWHVNFIE